MSRGKADYPYSDVVGWQLRDAMAKEQWIAVVVDMVRASLGEGVSDQQIVDDIVARLDTLHVAGIVPRTVSQRDFPRPLRDDGKPARLPKLGPHQMGVLRSLCGRTDGRKTGPSFYPGAGWTWDTDYRTRRVLDSLCERNLVAYDRDRDRYTPMTVAFEYLTLIEFARLIDPKA